MNKIIRHAVGRPRPIKVFAKSTGAFIAGLRASHNPLAFIAAASVKPKPCKRKRSAGGDLTPDDLGQGI